MKNGILTLNIKTIKTYNFLLSLLDRKLQNKIPLSFPQNMYLSLSNNCNLSCKICSINNLKEKNIKRSINNISLKDIEKFKELLKRVRRVNFMGHIGESVVNPEFSDIVRYVKLNFSPSMLVSTNGLGLTEKIQNTMLETGFNSIAFSFHSPIPVTHQLLQGGDFNKIKGNLERIQKIKIKKNLKYPKITVIYALNKKNIEETPKMIDIVKNLKVNKLYLYHYNDYGFNDIALNNDKEYANQVIDKIYDYARENEALEFLPKNKPYFKELLLEKEPEKEERCFLPWTDLHLKSSYSHSNSLYISCCNTLNLFLLNYREFIDQYEDFKLKKIWNHSFFQYLRLTVNSNSKYSRNPICAYCKSNKRKFYKQTDNKENYKIKMEMLDKFFIDYENYLRDNNLSIESIKGLTLLRQEDEELAAMA